MEALIKAQLDAIWYIISWKYSDFINNMHLLRTCDCFVGHKWKHSWGANNSETNKSLEIKEELRKYLETQTVTPLFDQQFCFRTPIRKQAF